MGPERLDTLPARMIAYASLYRDRCAQLAQGRGKPFDEALEDLFPGAGAYWRQLDTDLLCTLAHRPDA